MGGLSISEGSDYGTLNIQVVSGKGLKSMETFGKNDPYCVVKIGDKTKRTKTHKNGGANPVWEDTLAFTLIKGLDEMEISCYDEDMGKDDFIGKCMIPLSDVKSKKLIDEEVEIKGKSGKSHGTLRVIQRFESH